MEPQVGSLVVEGRALLGIVDYQNAGHMGSRRTIALLRRVLLLQGRREHCHHHDITSASIFSVGQIPTTTCSLGRTQFDKFQVGAFGRCPRVYCQGQNVLPAGLSDVPRNCTVAVYCPKCQVRRMLSEALISILIRFHGSMFRAL